MSNKCHAEGISLSLLTATSLSQALVQNALPGCLIFGGAAAHEPMEEEAPADDEELMKTKPLDMAGPARDLPGQIMMIVMSGAAESLAALLSLDNPSANDAATDASLDKWRGSELDPTHAQLPGGEGGALLLFLSWLWLAVPWRLRGPGVSVGLPWA